MSNDISVSEDVEFDEAWYLSRYPDIAKAISDGKLRSGRDHYLKHGKGEGRKPGPLSDRDWYLKAYPFAAGEVAGNGLSLANHYRSAGLNRGYLTGPTAERKSNAAGYPSVFGGLWFDCANALDLIEGKRVIGRLNDHEAKLLTTFVNDGFVVLRSAIPSSVLDRAEEALESAYDGKIQDLLFECHSIAKTGNIHWASGVKECPAKALDPHWLSADIRDLIFSDRVRSALHLIFERPALASQTLGFYRGSAQPLHQDSSYVAYSLPMQFAASWIALEDVKEGAGALEYLVGSHRKLPEFLYPKGTKSISESGRLGATAAEILVADNKHGAEIVERGKQLGLRRELFMAKRGDVLIWHSDLAHGGSPISQVHSRKSIVTHYCPSEIAPLFFETGNCQIHRHESGEFYTSGVYAGTAPKSHGPRRTLLRSLLSGK